MMTEISGNIKIISHTTYNNYSIVSEQSLDQISSFHYKSLKKCGLNFFPSQVMNITGTNSFITGDHDFGLVLIKTCETKAL